VLVQDLLEAIDGVALLIDRGLVVRQVGWRNWNSFWVKNGGGAGPASVVGNAVIDFFTEGEVRDTYNKLFCEVFARKRRSIQVDYRCDSPTLRRSMRLAVTPVDTGEEVQYLLYQSTILSVEQRPAIPLFDAPAVGSSQPAILKICSICAKVQWPPGNSGPEAEWLEPQEYYRRGGGDVALLSHGFCFPCYQALEAEQN